MRTFQLMQSLLAIALILTAGTAGFAEPATITIPVSKDTASNADSNLSPGIHFTNWSGKEDDRSVNITVNGKTIHAKFNRGFTQSQCPAHILREAGIPITVAPTEYMNAWEVAVGQSDPSQTPRLVHWLTKKWQVPLDVSMGPVSRRGLTVEVTEVDGTLMNDAFIVGQDFFAPGNFNVTDTTIQYKGPLHFAFAPSHTGPTLSEEEVRKIDAGAALAKAELEVELKKRLREKYPWWPFYW